MSRVFAIALAGYGFALARKSTTNIARLRREAEAGSVEAREHFTQTRYARVFGPRNSDLGMVFYTAVGVAGLTGLIRRRLVVVPLLLASAGSVVTSVYLLWALFVRLRVECRICLQAHVVNGGLFVVLLKLWRDTRE